MTAKADWIYNKGSILRHVKGGEYVAFIEVRIQKNDRRDWKRNIVKALDELGEKLEGEFEDA